MVATALTSSGSWMALTSIVVICLFMVITWFGNTWTKVEVEIGTQESSEGVVSTRHFTTEVDDPPSYASIQSEVTPPAYDASVIIDKI